MGKKPFELKVTLGIKIKPPDNRRCWLSFPLTRVPFHLGVWGCLFLSQSHIFEALGVPTVRHLLPCRTHPWGSAGSATRSSAYWTSAVRSGIRGTLGLGLEGWKAGKHVEGTLRATVEQEMDMKGIERGLLSLLASLHGYTVTQRGGFNVETRPY